MDGSVPDNPKTELSLNGNVPDNPKPELSMDGTVPGNPKSGLSMDGTVPDNPKPELSMDGSVPGNHAAALTERQGARHVAKHDMQAQCWLRERCCVGAIRRTERGSG